MTHLKILAVVIGVAALCVGAASSQTTISLGISGPGAVNDSTIKAGQPVSVDIYWENKDPDRRAFSTGFRIFSPTIKTIVHVPDSGKGINPAGDVKAHSGWEGTNTWDFGGIRASLVNWDGNLPDTIGFGGFRVKIQYNAHPKKKVLSWTMIVSTPGQITVDSTFFRPGGIWAVADPTGKEIPPVWHGPYKFTVVQ